MLPILTAEQVRAADAHTMAHEPISSVDLMERAATRCAQRIRDAWANGAFGPADQVRCLVLAGMGNNGGDGLVIARALHGAGMAVEVIRVEHRDRPSPDNAHNWQRASEMGLLMTSTHSPSSYIEGAEYQLIIDAIMGSGLAGPVSAPVQEAIRAVRGISAAVVAIDLPSGLLPEDNRSIPPDGIMQATWTLTLEVPKLALLLPENDRYVGRWEVVPIGLDNAFLGALPTDLHILEERDAMALLPHRPRFGHKGTFGHALVVAGCKGRCGAAVLATKAALRSGAGLVTVHAPAAGTTILQTSCPEAMCSISTGEACVEDLPALGTYSAVGMGPGIGTEPTTANVLKALLQAGAAPLVLDADALNILSEHRTWASFLPTGCILTPHPKEFDRLTGEPSSSGYERLQRARQAAVKWGCTIILKGAWTAICDASGAVSFNPTGNVGMAKGGSGDVLTGLLTGLLAQGMRPLDAARLGVYLHGLAGDIAFRNQGADGMTAMDVVHSLPEAWKQLRNGAAEQL